MVLYDLVLGVNRINRINRPTRINQKSNHLQPSRRLLIAALSLLIAAFLLFLFLPRNPGAYRAIPNQTSFLIECEGLLRAKILTDKTPDPHWKAVLHSPLFERCFEDAAAAIELLKHHPAVLRAFAKNKAMAAFSLHPSDQLHPLFVLELDEPFELEKTLKTKELFPKYFPHQFHGNDILNIHLSKNSQLEMAVSGRLLIFSRRATLVEDALAQLENTRSWWADRPYLKDLPNATLRLHLRPSALAEQWRGQMHERWRGLPDLLARNLEWAGIAWDGETLSALAESKGVLSGLGNWGKVPEQAIFNILPNNTAFLASTGLGNAPEFFNQIAETRSSDFDQYIRPWVGTEAAILVTEPLSPALSGDRLLLLSVRDSANALLSLQAFGKARGMLPGATGSYQMFEVFGFQNASLLKPLLGDDPAFRNPVCTMLDGYVVFAPDRSSLEVLLDKYLVNQTLASNIDFLQLQQKTTKKGHASLLLNAAYLPSLLRNIMGDEGEPALAPLGFLQVGLQPGFGGKMELFFTQQMLSEPPLETDVLWKSGFPARVANRPFLVEQPEGKIFVLAQDLKNNLHCLNAENGESIWSRSLPDRILSDIKGINFYGNNSKCYAFSTANELFVLDEKGRDVQGFPFKLPAPATNGVTMLDFDQNAQINYFVACENEKIYGFGHLGKPLTGWSGLPTQGRVTQPVLHFQHKGKDYLAVLTEEGRLSVYGRDGSLRFPPLFLQDSALEIKGRFNHPMSVDVGAASPNIYCANSAGKIFACNLQGKLSAKTVGKPDNVVAFGPLLGDARHEWALLDGKNLQLGTWSAKGPASLLKTQLPENQNFAFFIENHLATVDTRGRRIWLLDRNGKALPGFPLGGDTAFEFGRLNDVKMLVVGNGNGIWAYRMR